MGLLDKLLTGGAILVAGGVLTELSRQAREKAAEEQRRRSAPLIFNDGVSETEFVELATDVAQRLPRLRDFDVKGMTIVLHVNSNTGLSNWRAEIDFSDYGRLTGEYWLTSENDDSPIPEHFARTMRRELRVRLQAGQVAGAPQPAQTAELPTVAGVQRLPPAGWHPDPYRVARLRFWDGSKWTGYTG